MSTIGGFFAALFQFLAGFALLGSFAGFAFLAVIWWKCHVTILSELMFELARYSGGGSVGQDLGVRRPQVQCVSQTFSAISRPVIKNFTNSGHCNSWFPIG
jgi:hypothetical protein